MSIFNLKIRQPKLITQYNVDDLEIGKRYRIKYIPNKVWDWEIGHIIRCGERFDGISKVELVNTNITKYKSWNDKVMWKYEPDIILEEIL